MGINIRWVQTRLRELGFDPGPLDGIRGPRTDAAIVAFKRSVGLWPRAKLGPLTMAALRSTTNAPTSIPWMAEAEAVRGLHEQRDVAKLRGWFDKSVAWMDPREVPWCGAFVATCFRKVDPDIELPKNPAGARNWQHWGQSTDPVFGALLVFWRISVNHWAGHVGFYYGEDTTHYHVLGGNQSNAVNVMRKKKDHLLSARWPEGVRVTGRKIFLTGAGVPITTNEA